jgi:hypothetical protein
VPRIEDYLRHNSDSETNRKRRKTNKSLLILFPPRYFP